MDSQELDFQEAPKNVSVPFNHFHDFCALCQQRRIVIHSVTPKQGFYRLHTNTPLPDDMKHLVIEDAPKSKAVPR